MQLANWNRTVVNEIGEIIPFATVTVLDEATGDPAEIYEDRGGTTPLANPFDCGEDGFAEFYARGGEYSVEAVGPLGSITWRYELIMDITSGYKTSQESFSTVEKNKLAGIQAGAEVNQSVIDNLVSISTSLPVSANQARLLNEDLQQHKGRADNPHSVTIEQLGFDSWEEVDVGAAILNAHRIDPKPHRFPDLRDGTNFFLGLEISEDGIPILVYEEDE